MRFLAATAGLLLALGLAGDGEMRTFVRAAETEYFPGLRKPPALSAAPWDPYAQDDRSYIIAQITGYIEEQARRRFEQNQRQMEHAKHILRQQQALDHNRLYQMMQHNRPTSAQQQQQQQQLEGPISAQPLIMEPSPAQALMATVDEEPSAGGESFSYVLPGLVDPADAERDAPPPFAVGPNDPRFYESAGSAAGDSGSFNKHARPHHHRYTLKDIIDYNDAQQMAEQQAMSETKGSSSSDTIDRFYKAYRAGHPAVAVAASAERFGKDDLLAAGSNADDVPAYKLKAPMQIKANEATAVVGPTATNKVREDINLLVQKLQTNGQASAIMNGHGDGGRGVGGSRAGELVAATAEHADVVRKQMDMNSVVDMYVVAIIAGISASVTVGLIAIGIGWYTLHKKSMAAADVEYPAYGVTGPNKDASPSTGDRRLAQSAQMYHYQHQKQQIIAMESRTHAEHRNGSLTDAESDEENEEGDYTVYECPGLAPTGEMEVKNPLFLDDPTPASPANLVNNKPTAADDKESAKKAK